MPRPAGRAEHHRDRLSLRIHRPAVVARRDPRPAGRRHPRQQKLRPHPESKTRTNLSKRRQNNSIPAHAGTTDADRPNVSNTGNSAPWRCACFGYALFDFGAQDPEYRHAALATRRWCISKSASSASSSRSTDCIDESSRSSSTAVRRATAATHDGFPGPRDSLFCGICNPLFGFSSSGTLAPGHLLDPRRLVPAAWASRPARG